MPDKDIIMAKTAIVQRCLRRIKDVTGLDPNNLENIDKEDIFILNLQRGVQATIELATHVWLQKVWGFLKLSRTISRF